MYVTLTVEELQVLSCLVQHTTVLKQLSLLAVSACVWYSLLF